MKKEVLTINKRTDNRVSVGKAIVIAATMLVMSMFIYSHTYNSMNNFEFTSEGVIIDKYTRVETSGKFEPVAKGVVRKSRIRTNYYFTVSTDGTDSIKVHASKSEYDYYDIADTIIISYNTDTSKGIVGMN